MSGQHSFLCSGTVVWQEIESKKVSEVLEEREATNYICVSEDCLSLIPMAESKLMDY